MKASIFSLIRLLATTVAIPLVHATPLTRFSTKIFSDVPDAPKPASDPSLWAYLGTGIALTLLGGAFAGLTIALMGQDEIYLQVISTSGEGSERKNASKVLRLLKRGKHWVLVTLLLGNVITNETLPLALDRALGGGVAAAVCSTILVVIFGEVVPQSICVRYGLPIGAVMAPFVLVLMWLLAPIAWPTAKLLDYLLGEDHGTTYKKAGLKTLVTLHKSLGSTPGERLNQDEVTIISAVLDLKAKSVGSIMTPMNDVYTMSADTVLDQDTVDEILQAGYSRIPIYEPRNPRNFVGMLLVKLLITYDPEDCWKVNKFSLATLPETAPTTSCLDIVNFFQEGKSHMVLVSDSPGESYGALGVVTLEDVIEELIGEEIVDESDVFVDVHKAIRRIAPGPIKRARTAEVVAEPESSQADGAENAIEANQESKHATGPETRHENGGDGNGPPSKRDSVSEIGRMSPNPSSFLARRKSSTGGSMDNRFTPLRRDNTELKQHLKHLGPSNVASRPKATRYNTVKIKPGIGTIPEVTAGKDSTETPATPTTKAVRGPDREGEEGFVGTAGRNAKDGVYAVAASYGTLSSPDRKRRESQPGEGAGGKADGTSPQGSPKDTSRTSEKLIVGEPRRSSTSSSDDTLGSLHSPDRSRRRDKHRTRTGSITELHVDQGGVKKIVLEMMSSGSEDDVEPHEEEDSKTNGEERANSQRRKKQREGRSKSAPVVNGGDEVGGQSESTPLLPRHE